MLPLIAGLAMASAFACSEGTSPADEEAGGSGNAGGSDNAGGSGNAGGSTASTKPSGGAASEGGAPSTVSTGVTKAWEFANDGENFLPSYAKAFLLTDSATEDTAASAALLSGTTVEWNMGEGYGKVPGFLEVGMPFAPTQSTYQQVEVAALVTPSLDLSGKILHCYVKLVSGANVAGDTSNVAGGKLVVKTGSAYTYAGGIYTNLVTGTWVDLSIDATTPDDVPSITEYNPAEVVQIAISVNTSGSATAAEPAVLHIDHCWY